jgi:signal transduction histidine kinase
MLTRRQHEATAATARPVGVEAGAVEGAFETRPLAAKVPPVGAKPARAAPSGHPIARLFPVHLARGTADRLLAVAITGVGIARLAHERDLPDFGGWALVCAGAAALAWRHSAPRLVLLISAATFSVYHAAGYPHPGLPVALLISVYTVATRNAAAAAAVLSGAAMTVAAGARLVRDGPSPTDFDDTLFAYMLCIGAACALGYGVQLTRARAELLRQQADQLAYEHALHETQLLQGLRSEIARDMHDVISHQVTVITALAAGAGRLFEAQPDRARAALQSIETAGRDALGEMRRLLRVLRPDGVDSSRLPPPGLAQLPELIAQTTQTGLSVRLTVTGTPRALPVAVETCAYRIVQEALTNTVKHAGPATARVTLRYEPAGVEVVVADTGHGPAPSEPTSGHGLVGMQERVALLGGRVQVGRPIDGGTSVHAWLPAEGDHS